ncbi:MAG: hypothetical protein GY791_09005 [Alphaproteobacteria bacterium]|nr:hypothetical protein [Alphaproteobacteria bacterium]
MDIQIGHRFQSKSPPNYLWQVDGLRTDYRGLAHARLIRVDDPLDSRVISAAALQSDDLYVALDAIQREDVHSQPVTPLLRLFGTFLRSDLILALAKKPHVEPRL